MRKRNGLGTRKHLDFCHGLVAEATLGDVDDAFKRKVVAWLVDEAQIGERVPDFGAFVKPEASDDPVRHADRDEAVLELAALVLRADENGDAVEAVAALGSPLLPALDLVANAARLLGAVPDADNLDPLALRNVGEQCFTEAARVMGNDAAGSSEDVRRAAVILLESDDFGTRKILFKLEDIFDLRAAPTVD